MKIYYNILVILLIFNGCSAQSKKCNNLDNCKKEIISQGYKIGFILADRFIIYGNIDTIFSKEHIQFSTTLMMDSKSGESILEPLFCEEKEEYSYCLPFMTSIEMTDTIVNITHYGRLAYGNNWEFIDIPIFKQKIGFNIDSVYRITANCIIEPKKITLQQAEEILKEFNHLKSKGIELLNYQAGIDSIALLINQLFICSLADYEECKFIFLNLEVEFPGSTSGILGDIYWRWIGLYDLYLKQSK